MIDELALVELTNEQIEPHCLEHMSAGQVVKAMILNALGFLSAPLYLFSEFCESKAGVPPAGVGRRSSPPEWWPLRAGVRSTLRGRHHPIVHEGGAASGTAVWHQQLRKKWSLRMRRLIRCPRLPPSMNRISFSHILVGAHRMRPLLIVLGGLSITKSAFKSLWAWFRNHPSLFHFTWELSMPRIAR